MKRVWVTTCSEGHPSPSMFATSEWAFHDLDVRMSSWPGARFTLRSYMVPDTEELL